MTIRAYTEKDFETWNNFVLHSSINGNFLQSKQFLDYHPENRFTDASLMYFDAKNNLRAVIPAASVDNAFVSHPGSTYGGIVFDAKTCSAKRLQTIIEELIDWLKAEKYSSAKLKITPSFMWQTNESSLLEYLLFYNGFREYDELTTYIDFATYLDSTLSALAQGKRTCVNHALREGYEFKVFQDKQTAKKFYELLCNNLRKYETSPVHTFDELWNLYSIRLADMTELVGVFHQDELLAAGWVFMFENQQVAHTQYLAAAPDFGKLSPMTFLYYSVIEHYRNKHFRSVSWGISTEDCGRVLNWGLTNSKENFGSTHGVHRTFEIDLV